MKPGVPVAIGAQPDAVTAVLLENARRIGARVWLRDHDWAVAPEAVGFRFVDVDGRLMVPPPSLPGAHQLDNAGIAIAALRASGLAVSDEAIAVGIAAAEWPARLQRLHGRLARSLPPGWELWLDGGHNPGAGEALATHLATWRDRPIHLIVGMKDSKDAVGFLRPLLPHAATLWAVAEPGQHSALPVEAIIAASGGVARAGPHVADALGAIAREPGPARVLICGTLYLAGEVLKTE
jgi:dihydrofolate synthase/folylpolyglutamate synthase